MSRIRVVHFGLGPIGAAVLRQVAARPGFKIVGGIDVDPAKVGRDLGEVAGLSKPLGLRVDSRAGNVLKVVKPDVVVHCTTSSLERVMPELRTILAARAAVVSTTEELTYPGYAHPRLARQLHTLAKRAMRRHVAMASALLAHGADPAAPIKNWTPTRRSSKDHNFAPELVGATPYWLGGPVHRARHMRLLLKHGADPQVVHTGHYHAEEPVEPRSHVTTTVMAATGMGGGAAWVPPDRRNPRP